MSLSIARTSFAATLLVGCGGASASSPPSSVAATTMPAAQDSASAAPARFGFTAVPLPGATAPASLDYLAYEPRHARVWVPVGTTGSVDVFNTKTGAFDRIDGFKTMQREVKGRTRTMGPSAVAIGAGVAYVGNRASSEVCPIDTESLRLGACVTLTTPTDGVAYVGTAKEVWVTTPHDQSITVLDVSEPMGPKVKTSIHLDGAPEGYAVDAKRGLFFTNLEDKNKTVLIDIRRHATVVEWDIRCGEEGPRGVAVDAGEADDRELVFVACTDRVLVLDGRHDGALLGTIESGAGVDNIDWLPSRHTLYVAAGKSATVRVDRIDPSGQGTPLAVGTSVEGARNGVADDEGNVYVADPVNARLLVFAAPKVLQ
jgi:DNA-binding beta-propeller fold protein YncE